MGSTEEQGRPHHPAIKPKRPERRRGVPTRESLAASAPWLPVPWKKVDAYALQALARGEADPRMQKLALQWITEQAAGRLEMAFRPGGEDGRRETDFFLGRIFVGQQIAKLLRINLAAIPNDDPRADAPEPRE